VKQIISKDGKVICTTAVPYPAKIVKAMRKAGYKVAEVKGE
jgi:predicted fused transcriptional regulator/phosphomethylpyrimidine kinase